ncbi:MAG: rod shape-determining protein MreC [Cyanobacteriota bacterium]|nr:rod shape-determining protein MreC [Cyanobacteriota bacterium]
MTNPASLTTHFNPRRPSLYQARRSFVLVNAIRQWWNRYGLSLSMSILAMGLALAIRQSNGKVLVESYRWMTALWQPSIDHTLIMSQAANQELQAQVAELQYQNRELKKLLGFSDQILPDGLPAPVIGRSADHWWQQLTLARGSLQQVKPGDVVMAPGGLVGRVQQVTPHTSRILLISDPTSRVGVMVSRSRHMGVMRGSGSQTAILEFFDKNPKVEVGDNVVTSGLSSLYPAGLVVGKVRAINLDASPAPQAQVDLTAPLGLMEWGLIYSYVPAPTLTP